MRLCSEAVRVPMVIAASPIPPPSLFAPPVATEQEGVFTRQQARGSGFSDAEQRRLLRHGLWLPIVGGVVRPHDLEAGPWQRARAVWLLGRIVSHATAGALWGLAVDDSLHGTRTHGRRVPGLVDHEYAPRELPTVDAAGMRVTSALRTLTDLLCTLDEGPAVSMLADGFRRGLVDAMDVAAAAREARGRTGVNRVRALAESCAGEPWSWLEWRFQSAARAMGPGWRFNVRIEDVDGSPIVVDALHEPTGTIVELDGRQFHGDDRFQVDRTRDQRLAACGYLVIRITWDDLTHRFDLVLSRIARAIAARSSPASGWGHAAKRHALAG